MPESTSSLRLRSFGRRKRESWAKPRRRPLCSNASDSSIDRTAGIEGIVRHRLQHPHNTLRVRDDQERNIVSSEHIEEGRIDNKRRSVAQIVRSIGWIEPSGRHRRASRRRIRGERLRQKPIRKGLMSGDGEYRLRKFRIHAQALRAPVGKEQQRSNGIRRGQLWKHAWNIERSKSNGLVSNGRMRRMSKIRQRLTKQSIAPPGQRNRNSFVRSKRSGKRRIERVERSCNGRRRSLVELLERSQRNAIRIQLVQRLRRLSTGVRWSRRQRDGSCRDACKQIRLACKRKRKSIRSVDELHETNRFVERFSSERVIGDRGEHGLRGSECPGLVFEVQLCIDEA